MRRGFTYWSTWYVGPARGGNLRPLAARFVGGMESSANQCISLRRCTDERLADASRRAHVAVAVDDAGALAAAVADIDMSAGAYWGLSAPELGQYPAEIVGRARTYVADWKAELATDSHRYDARVSSRASAE